MKKLILLSTGLFVFASLGLSANAFADHRDVKDAMKKTSNEAEYVASDLVNEAGGAANSIVGEAADAVDRIGQHMKNGFKHQKHDKPKK
ncbi:MAG: hypothetical protein QNK11_09490 [Legionella sp.]|nr:hypothetical protein [Legionella sp.]